MSIFSSFANQARLRSFGGTGGGTGASDMDILLLRSARRRDAIDHAVMIGLAGIDPRRSERGLVGRSEEHTSELQSLMSQSYAGFCLKKTQNHYYDVKIII